jgi:hypothetical protein
MKPMRSVRRLPPRLAFWALAGVALLISHDAAWLAQIGPGEAFTSALRHGGHDYWGAASAGLTVVGILAATWAGIRLYRLRRRSSRSKGTPAGLGARPYIRRAGGAWLRLFVVVAIGFVVQENLEHALTHGHGLWAGALLGPEYPLALPVIGAITLLAALVAAAFVTAERILLAQLVPAHHTLRAPRRVERPVRRIVLPGGVDAHTQTGRGPPALLVPV